MKNLATLYVAAATPMGRLGEIDAMGFRKNIDWYIKQGATGILVCGGTAEFASLSPCEKRTLAEIALDEAAGRASVIFGASEETTAGAIELSRFAKSAGMDAVMIIAPWYQKPSPDELFSHLSAISDAARLPIILYNHPGCSGTDIKPSEVARLSTIENVVGIKESSGIPERTPEIKKLVSPEFTLFAGADDIIGSLLEGGATSWISITANLIPAECQKIMDLVSAGDLSGATALCEKYQVFCDLMEKRPKPIQAAKYALERRGVYGGPCRAPRGDLTEEEKAYVDKLLKEFGLV